MRFGVLGPLAVRAADGKPAAVRETKVRAVLAALLVHAGRPVTADRLIEGLWGTRQPVHPAAALRAKVSRLPAALERAEPGARGLVEWSPAGYLLRTGDGYASVDAERFRTLTARARTTAAPAERAALLADALALWRGPAYADFADEAFVRPESARLEEERLTALEDRAEARLTLGEHIALAGELSAPVTAHPLRERLRAAHLRALYGAGRQGEALASYQELSRLLADELGVDPGPELAALHEAMLRQEPALTPGPAPYAARPPVAAPPPATNLPAPPTNLPAPLSGLIGREAALAGVRERLGRGRLVTLTGPGGVGKTRLALAAAAESAEPYDPHGLYEDGVRLAELAALERTADVPRIARTLATVLGLRDEGRTTTAEQLADALRTRRMLLVLDNCEHVIGPVAELTGALLRTAPGLRVLATSRAPLEVSGELVFPVPPLETPPPGASHGALRESGAVRLFAERAAAAVPGFTVGEDNAAAVAAVCRRLDGLPLALELAATRMRMFGAAELAERLDDRFAVLAGGRRAAPARQQTLRGVIDWSWELLTGAERTVLRRLSVYADGCTLEAAEAVCAGDGVRRSEVLGLLGQLVDRSLVVAVAGPPARYRLLESVHAYARERLAECEDAEPGGTERVRARHHRYYVEWAERAEPRLRGHAQRDWLRRLDAETANLRTALDGLARGTGEDAAELALRLVNALSWYWYLRGRLGEARAALDLALTLHTPGPVPEPIPHPGPIPSPKLNPLPETAPVRDLRARARAWRAGIALLILDGADRTPLERIPDFPAAVEDPAARAMAQWFLGFAHTGFGDPAVSRDLIDRAYAGFTALGDPWGTAAALSVRASQLHASGTDTALRDSGRSLALFEQVGDGWGMLRAMRVRRGLVEIAGDYAAAEGLDRDGLRLAEELGLNSETTALLSRTGRTALLRGDLAAAEEYHERARRLAVHHADQRAREVAEVGLALVARRQGRLAVAEAHLRTWLAWCRQWEGAPGIALILAELGFVAELRGDAAAATALHEEGLAAARGTGDIRAVALALEGAAGARVDRTVRRGGPAAGRGRGRTGVGGGAAAAGGARRRRADRHHRTGCAREPRVHRTAGAGAVARHGDRGDADDWTGLPR
ncbi:BTAD domain-containing putative transcriptional regulator [Streptomyces uncialis]|uniref:BTAD domain-containing putative transcriptional regulator n=1 Tax=Streptomyces uncialis TaxID=1048205 RepID=UPI00224EECF9|nr:BTAD domain-containing putative transcriptional regulator [Streptomyces uncialis]MCX4661618.1 NB-ARC domain-containing protein [Streptomyces uncialis]